MEVVAAATEMAAATVVAAAAVEVAALEAAATEVAAVEAAAEVAPVVEVVSRKMSTDYNQSRKGIDYLNEVCLLSA